jgi:hypothetical protein
VLTPQAVENVQNPLCGTKCKTKAAEILERLAQIGLEISYDRENEKLVLAGSPGALACKEKNELLAEIRAHRGELLQKLISPDALGYSDIDWVFRLGRIELERRRLAEAADAAVSTVQPAAAAPCQEALAL